MVNKAFLRNTTTVTLTSKRWWHGMTIRENTQKRTTIADRLDSARSLQVQHNRYYIKTVAEVILLCAQQDIGLRGHHESQSSLNRGNFLEILSLVESHDTTVQERLLCGPRNAVYTSPDTEFPAECDGKHG